MVVMSSAKANTEIESWTYVIVGRNSECSLLCNACTTRFYERSSTQVYKNA